MSFAAALDEGAEPQDAYKRLIMDVIRGDQTLFMRGDELEAAWTWTDPITSGWESSHLKPNAYDAGSSGPEEALMVDLLRALGTEISLEGKLEIITSGVIDRPVVEADLLANQFGMGWELFATFRNSVGSATEGATIFGGTA